MNFIQKIYYNDKPLILTTDSEAFINENPVAELYTLFSVATIRNFNQAVQHLEIPGTKGAIIEDISEINLKNCLYDLYQNIDAGGGIVMNEKEELLLIFRRGKWDLPKGKCDEGEQIDQCALREVSEETGLQNITLLDKFGDSYHLYAQNNQQIIKHTTWFKMKSSSEEKLKPQKEENIIEARWVSSSELAPLLNKSYEAIRDVMRQANIKW